MLDFVLLGGASLIALPLIEAWPAADATHLTSVALIASLFIQPHFLHSYQLAYARFRARLLGTEFPPGLRARYAVVTLIVPALLLFSFVVAVRSNQPKLLGHATLWMFFTVGWHYVKQGFGILMLDAVRKKRFFTARGKRILLINAYVCWIAAWLRTNGLPSHRSFLGFPYDAVALPAFLTTVALALAACSSLAALWVVVQQRRRAGTLPWLGLFGYAASLYPWLFFISPRVLLWIPAFHALQYYAVVWRMRANRERAASSDPDQQLAGLARFAVVALLGSTLGFWIVPRVLDAAAPVVVGAEPVSYMFFFWLFLNVHHYFLDHVIWRKENPDTRRDLYAAA